jgi:hypothetical protein
MVGGPAELTLYASSTKACFSFNEPKLNTGQRKVYENVRCDPALRTLSACPVVVAFGGTGLNWWQSDNNCTTASGASLDVFAFHCSICGGEEEWAASVFVVSYADAVTKKQPPASLLASYII